MAVIRIIEGSCGEGVGRYETGLFTLPDGSEHGVECLETFTFRNEIALEGRWADEIVGGIRGAIGATAHLPLRLAALGASKGIGLIDRAIRPEAVLEARFNDGTRVVAATEASVIHQIRNDCDVVRQARSRGIIATRSHEASLSDASEIQTTITVDPAAQSDSTSLASIFRYEKRKGRLRRVPRNDETDEA